MKKKDCLKWQAIRLELLCISLSNTTTPCRFCCCRSRKLILNSSHLLYAVERCTFRKAKKQIHFSLIVLKSFKTDHFKRLFENHYKPQCMACTCSVKFKMFRILQFRNKKFFFSFMSKSYPLAKNVLQRSSKQ